MSTAAIAAPAREGDTLAGRVAFVTGGTRGIGAAMCHSLASEGATVAAGYHSGSQPAGQVCADLEAYGVATSSHQGNIGAAEDCRRTVGEVIERHGRLDILVNSAGITSDKAVLNLTDEDWYTVVAVNLSGAFFTSQAALPHMLDYGDGGRGARKGARPHQGADPARPGSAAPRRSPAWCTSSPRTRRPTSEVRSGASTAASTCDRRRR
jgi:NAD(P)-dependent dehydrogenase (short-subunit alcohol dehydrogenase family)